MSVSVTHLCVYVCSHTLLFPRDEKMNGFVGLDHLGGALGAGDSRQSVRVEARVQRRAGEGGGAAAGLQHVAHLAVEMCVGGQTVKDQVLNALYCVSEGEEKKGKALERNKSAAINQHRLH